MKIGNFQSLYLRKDFISLNRRGYVVKNNAFFVKYIHYSSLCGSKVAFSIKKKIGKAHERNKIKRRLREILRQLELKNKIICLIIAQPSIIEYSFNRLADEINILFSKIDNCNCVKLH